MNWKTVSYTFLFFTLSHILDKEKIDDLLAKIGMGGGGGDVDMDMLNKRFASKLPPDSTIVRIEELEKLIKKLSEKCIQHDKTLYQNNILDKSVTEPIKEEVVEDDNAKSVKDDGTVVSEMEKILLEIEALNNCDMDLTARMQILEKALKGTTIQVNTNVKDISDLKIKMEGLLNVEPVSATGDIDTGALIKLIKSLEVQLHSHKESTEKEFTTVRSELSQCRLDCRQYTDNEVSSLSQTLTKQFDSAMSNLRHELERLRAEFEQHKNKDFVALELRVTALEKRISALIQRIENMPVGTGGGNMDEGRMRALEDRVAALENALDQLKNDISRWIKDLTDMINSKPDFDKLEQLIQDRFNEIVKALTKQFADKGEMRKVLKMHEKQIQNIYNVVMTRCGGTGEGEEDAMFSKKPLKGLSCASCEKGLENMYGKKVEFMAWNKMPFRDPSERIARVGQGFSKMLSMLNPDQMSRYEQPMNRSQHNPNLPGFKQTKRPGSHGGSALKQPTTTQ